jgi:hypothetical protein
VIACAVSKAQTGGPTEFVWGGEFRDNIHMHLGEAVNQNGLREADECVLCRSGDNNAAAWLRLLF